MAKMNMNKMYIKTVMDTIKLLRENEMLNPGVKHRGDRQREAALLRLYSEFRTTNKSAANCKAAD